MIASSNMFSYINQIWWSDAVWRTVEAPKFKPGFIGAAAAGAAIALTCLVVRFLEIRDVKRREWVEDGPRDVESPVGGETVKTG